MARSRIYGYNREGVVEVQQHPRLDAQHSGAESAKAILKLLLLKFSLPANPIFKENAGLSRLSARKGNSAFAGLMSPKSPRSPWL